ncbi:hypothetical protein D9758_012406 [Tetrapyrgos nigripes]|uniref:MYND-type domain-containing protein n=1 Tax=Tetrapyrgos nigripes TaxID=182062 RepID=A0A8H5FYM3_9AGAR|nr:hypothetical protein D9758_012406 [Tetrapyrgos nigripes]
MPHEELNIPPITTAVLQACQKCFKDDTREALSRCSKCRSVAYCGAACQKADWKGHKVICKAMSSLDDISIYHLTDAISTDLEATNRICEENAQNETRAIQLALRRSMTVQERNLVGWQPKCYGCARTDRIIRLEKSADHASLGCCPDCRLAFYCSQEHWDAVKHFHTGPSKERDGLSQCQMNQQFRMDIRFQYSVPDAGPFMWAPERSKPIWEPLKAGDEGTTCWEEEFGKDLEMAMQGARVPVVIPFLRAASRGLSMPLTILYALQKLHGEDQVWTSKDTLVIHIMGASISKEMMSAQLFEEILHRIPNVKTLKLVLIGPEVPDSGSVEMETCPDCTRKRRKRIHAHHSMLYHDYVHRQSTKFVAPDLAIAFNSGASELATDGSGTGPGASWKETIKLLVEKKIPSVFTSFNHSEATTESQTLRDYGATLLATEDLGPRKNPWGSMHLIPEPNNITGWYGENMWFTGGFKG